MPPKDSETLTIKPGLWASSLFDVKRNKFLTCGGTIPSHSGTTKIKPSALLNIKEFFLNNFLCGDNFPSKSSSHKGNFSLAKLIKFIPTFLLLTFVNKF